MRNADRHERIPCPGTKKSVGGRWTNPPLPPGSSINLVRASPSGAILNPESHWGIRGD